MKWEQDRKKSPFSEFPFHLTLTLCPWSADVWWLNVCHCPRCLRSKNARVPDMVTPPPLCCDQAHYAHQAFLLHWPIIAGWRWVMISRHSFVRNRDGWYNRYGTSAPPTLHSPDWGRGGMCQSWCCDGEPDNMILFTLAHKPSSWSQHRPGNIIMPSSHISDTLNMRRNPERATYSATLIWSKYAWDITLKTWKLFTGKQYRAWFSFAAAALKCHKEIPIKERGYPRAGDAWSA